MEDDVLGTLVWTESTDAWESSIVIAPHTTMQISLIPLGEDVEPMVKRARLFVSRFTEHDLKLRQAAAASLLVDCNDWCVDGKEIDTAEFIARLTIDGVNFFNDGTAEVYYFDGGLFANHLSVIPINDDGSLAEPYIAG